MALAVVTALVTCVMLGGCTQETAADDTSDTENASSNVTTSENSATNSTSGFETASVQAEASFSSSASYEGELTPNVSESFFIYVGLIDADTGTQVLSEDEALATVEQTLADERQGATVIPTWGGYVAQDGTYMENGTILVIIQADEQTIRELVDAWFDRLNTAAIYVERYSTENGFLFASSES